MLDKDNIMTTKACEVFRRSLQMKKIVANATCALYFLDSHIIFSRKGWMLIRHSECS